jgi:hypothetical protein
MASASSASNRSKSNAFLQANAMLRTTLNHYASNEGSIPFTRSNLQKRQQNKGKTGISDFQKAKVRIKVRMRMVVSFGFEP